MTSLPRSSTRNPALVLASSSPRRREILASLGVEFIVQAAAIDEQRLPAEPAADMVLRLARDKALGVASATLTHALVLGADTVVVLDDRVFGKPQDKQDAHEMLMRLSGRAHRVLTGVVVARGAWSGIVSETEVRFRDIGSDEARRYWQSGEPRGKAGGYAIQGYGGLFVSSIMGSYTGVVGLPVFETGMLLRDAGLEILPAAG